MPNRIQLKRTKGWRKPAGAVVVSRPSIFGNPFTVAAAIETGFAKNVAEGRAIAVEAFRDWLTGSDDWWQGPKAESRRKAVLEALPGLRGKDLCCWCPVGSPCHADVLLELANAVEVRHA